VYIIGCHGNASQGIEKLTLDRSPAENLVKIRLGPLDSEIIVLTDIVNYKYWEKQQTETEHRPALSCGGLVLSAGRCVCVCVCVCRRWKR